MYLSPGVLDAGSITRPTITPLTIEHTTLPRRVGVGSSGIALPFVDRHHTTVCLQYRHGDSFTGPPG
jgi:hypothetical protein